MAFGKIFKSSDFHDYYVLDTLLSYENSDYTCSKLTFCDSFVGIWYIIYKFQSLLSGSGTLNSRQWDEGVFAPKLDVTRLIDEIFKYDVIGIDFLYIVFSRINTKKSSSLYLAYNFPAILVAVLHVPILNLYSKGLYNIERSK